ncbi:MAG: hypothetical protein JWP96_1861 [Polaromonas sp.]|nr:hypothetical protein [Polaromonas sp.]
MSSFSGVQPVLGDATACADDLTRQNVESMRRVEQQVLANRSNADLIAAFVAEFCGSMPFVWLHVLLFFCWLALNSWPGLRHFDPYPFTFLTLVVSLEAIFLSAFILISQNYELRISDRRNQLDLQINLLTEQENTKMLQLLELIATKVGVDVASDAELRVLKQVTHPEKLLSQIEQAQQKNPL